MADKRRCKSWACKVCHRWQQARWSKNLQACILAHDGPIYLGTLPDAPTKKEWRSRTRDFQRRNASYCRVSLGSGRALVAATVPFPGAKLRRAGWSRRPRGRP
jgi:hypothetical protein